jgi:glycosyltransferase involved in cell wall biosynthesis
MTAVSTISEISENFRGGGRIRIAHLQLLPLVTGVQTVTLEEFRRLDRLRFDPYIICQQPGPLTEAAEREGIPCLFVPELQRSISPRQDWLALWRLHALFQEYAFDIVHTHSSKTGVLGRIAAYLADVPAVVHTVHGYAFPSARNALEKALFIAMEWISARCCGAMIVLKEHDRQIGRRYLHVPARRLHLLANGVDTDVYRPADQMQRRRIRRTRLGIGDETTAIGMVGRLWQQKNPTCFVNAAAEVLRKRSDIQFFLLGDGELRETLDEQIRAYDIASHVHILGWVEDIPELLPSLDIFVLPSRWEGLSLALLEALSSGVAAVVSDIPGNSDIIAHEVNGLLFRDADADDLAEKLLRLVQEPGLRERLALRGRADVIANYRLEDRLLRVTDLYHRLLFGNAVAI